MTETPFAKFVHLGRRGRKVTFEQAAFNNRILRVLFRNGTLSEAVLLNRLALKPHDVESLRERVKQLEEWDMLEVAPGSFSGIKKIRLLPDGHQFGMDLICNCQPEGKTPDGPDDGA